MNGSNEMPRLAPVDESKLDAGQQAVFDQITAGARGAVSGPFTVLLHNAALASRVEQLGAYLRYGSAIPPRQRELAICTVGAHWRAHYEWFAHGTLAEAAGVPASVLAELGSGRDPAISDAADRAVHAYASELLRTGRATDGAYHAAEAVLGQAGLLDLTALVGYYTLLALVLNAYGVRPPTPFTAPWDAA